MKLFTTIFLLLVVVKGHNSQFVCPLNSELKPIDGAFPDPGFCGIYYHCINGTAHPQQCPPGLLFTIFRVNCKYSLCVEPDMADCPGDSGENSQTFIETDKAFECSTDADHVNAYKKPCYMKNTDCEDGQNGTFPNKNDCRQYYHCHNGVAWPQQCPQGYFFSPLSNVRDCTSRICVTLEESQCPIPGGWSEWSQWSGCSPNCGDGLRTRTRSCTNPPPSNGGDECPGSSVDVELCLNPPCNLNKNPAFMVSMTTTVALNSGRMIWLKVNHDNGDLFNTTTNSLNIRTNGFYFLTSTGTTRDSFTSHFRMDMGNTGTSAELYQERSEQSDTFSRSGLFSLTSLFKPFTLLRNRVVIYGSETGAETSWTGFLYESDVGFFMGRNAAYTIALSLMPLPNVVSLRGVSVNTDRTELTVSTKGWYFINFGSGYLGGRHCIVSLTINGVTAFRERTLVKNHEAARSSQGSRGLIVELNENDRIGLTLHEGYSRSFSLHTYLSGFKLNATVHSPAFYAYKTSNIITSSRVKIGFEEVVLDTNSGWSSSDNSYRVTTAGLYYIDVSVGTWSFIQSVISVMVNNEKRLGMQRLAWRLGIESMSRGGLLKLEEGDRVSIETNHNVHSSTWKITSIALFYVSAL